MKIGSTQKNTTILNTPFKIDKKSKYELLKGINCHGNANKLLTYIYRVRCCYTT